MKPRVVRSLRYVKVPTALWRDPRFANLPPAVQHLYFFLLTNPQNNLIGAYLVPKTQLYQAVKVLSKDFESALKVLLKDFLLYCSQDNLLIFPDYLEHNPITNPNQRKGALRILLDLPRCGHLRIFQKYFHELTRDFWNNLKTCQISPYSLLNQDVTENGEIEQAVRAGGGSFPILLECLSSNNIYNIEYKDLLNNNINSDTLSYMDNKHAKLETLNNTENINHSETTTLGFAKNDACEKSDNVRIRCELVNAQGGKPRKNGHPRGRPPKNHELFSITPEDIIALWNEINPLGQSVPCRMTTQRRDKLRSRIEEQPTIEYWRRVFTNIRDIPYYRGENDRGWKATLDWVIKNDTNGVKIYEQEPDTDSHGSRLYASHAKIFETD